jgi:hypothetical protein
MRVVKSTVFFYWSHHTFTRHCLLYASLSSVLREHFIRVYISVVEVHVQTVSTLMSTAAV